MDREQIRNLRIGDVLKKQGYVEDEQLETAFAYQKEHTGIRIGEALIELGFITEAQMMQALAYQLRIKVIDISAEHVDPEAVRMIPRVLAEKYRMLAIRKHEDSLLVVLQDPLNVYGIEEVRQVTGMGIDICLCGLKELDNAIQFYYSEVEAREAANLANETFGGLADQDEFYVEEGESDAPIINLLNRLIDRAYTTNASDIHIEPFEDKTMLRMRVDGVIVEFVTLEKRIHAPLIARIKILGGMDIAERRTPQDGHFRVRTGNEWLNIRVSVIPTVFGEKAVLRLLAGNTQIDDSLTFGMRRRDYQRVRHMLECPNGIVYFTGPTGSGKTTTLYMVLAELAKGEVNITTIEDPVEQNVPVVNQMQVNEKAGLTFENGLRALLRQDPDIIMVGETRDRETAEISARAAMTGHLVLSTLHTNDAVSSIMRLEDMGLQPYVVTGSLVGVVAQRLMRKVCTECAVEDSPTEKETAYLGTYVPKVMRPKGCSQCNYTGYRGRIAIHEVLQIDRQVRRMIMDGAMADEIQDYAIEHQGMRTLKEAGLELVKAGISTVEELKRAAYDR